METKNKTFLKTFCTMFALLIFTFSSYAINNGNGNGNNGRGSGTNNNNGQNNNNSGFTQTNGNSTNNNGGKGSPSVPLDGGLSILLLGAAAFGVKKLRQK